MRGSYQTQELVKCVDNQSLCLCVNDPCSIVEYTYYSRGTQVTSQIDHFILSECTIDFNIEYFISVDHAKSEVTPKPTLYKSNDVDIN